MKVKKTIIKTEKQYNGRAIIIPTDDFYDFSTEEIYKDFFEDVLNGNLIADFIFKEDFLKKIKTEKDPDAKQEYYSDILYNLKDGFIVKYEYPIPNNIKENSFTHYGYGYYGTSYFFIRNIARLEQILNDFDKKLRKKIKDEEDKKQWKN